MFQLLEYKVLGGITMGQVSNFRNLGTGWGRCKNRCFILEFRYCSTYRNCPKDPGSEVINIRAAGVIWMVMDQSDPHQ